MIIKLAETSKMRKKIRQNTKVSLEAWRFDNLKMEKTKYWSYLVFSKQHMDASVHASEKKGLNGLCCGKMVKRVKQTMVKQEVRYTKKEWNMV